MEKKYRLFRTPSGVNALLFGMLLAGLLISPANAAVTSTPEAAGGADSVYVAGDPDWYPIEYYDPDTGRYEGVLPQLLQRIGERTGLDFTYIRAGKEDQRLRLAQNGQVEMVSGYALDAEELREHGLRASGAVLTIPREGGEIGVCFAFTEIAGDDLIDAVEDALQEISQQEAAEIALRFVMEHPEEPFPKGLFAAVAAALLILLAAVIILAVRLRRYKKNARLDDRYDLITGIGNKAYFTEYFEKFIPDQYRGLYCVVFIGFDIVRANPRRRRRNSCASRLTSWNSALQTGRSRHGSAAVDLPLPGPAAASRRPEPGQRKCWRA